MIVVCQCFRFQLSIPLYRCLAQRPGQLSQQSNIVRWRSNIKMGVTGRTESSSDLQQRLVQLQIEMMENEVRQMEIIKKIQADREISLTCQQSYQSTSEKALVESIKYLSKCDYFHGSLSWQEALTLLSCCTEGVFLVRRSHSQDSQFPYSLSFQRGEKLGGPTSIRIRLSDGRWSLDCQSVLVGKLPTFTNIESLIRYYIEISSSLQPGLINLAKGLPRTF